MHNILIQHTKDNPSIPWVTYIATYNYQPAPIDIIIWFSLILGIALSVYNGWVDEPSL